MSEEEWSTETTMTVEAEAKELPTVYVSKEEMSLSAL